VQSFIHRPLALVLTSSGSHDLLIAIFEVEIPTIFRCCTLVRRHYRVFVKDVERHCRWCEKLQVIKLRAKRPCRDCTPSDRVTGLQLLRTLGLMATRKSTPSARCFPSDSRLDKMLGGASRRRQPAGGRAVRHRQSALATQFHRQGCTMGSRGSWRSSKRPEGYLQRADIFGLPEGWGRKGNPRILIWRPLDFLLDERCSRIHGTPSKGSAPAAVIDSLVGSTMALRPVSARTSRVASIGMIRGADRSRDHDPKHGRSEDSFTALQFQSLRDFVSHRRHHPAALRRDRRPTSQSNGVVIKMRGGNHSKDIANMSSPTRGVVVIPFHRRTDYNGLSTGIPHRTGPAHGATRRSRPEPKAESLGIVREMATKSNRGSSAAGPIELLP